MPAVSTNWENRSLYWDIHQSHHRGLPDAAVAHQAIRYWKLTKDLVTAWILIFSHDVHNKGTRTHRGSSVVLSNGSHRGVFVFFGSFLRTENLWLLPARIHRQSVGFNLSKTFACVMNAKDCTEQIQCFAQTNELLSCQSFRWRSLQTNALRSLYNSDIYVVFTI